MKIYDNVPLANLTTMRLGGPARYVLEVEKPTDLPDAYGFANAYHYPTFILGGGANSIGHDEGFNGVIILNRLRGFNDENGKLTIMAGEDWDPIVEYACSKGYTGIEALSKIPGLTGAAPVQNIGAYGQDISQTFLEAEVYDIATGEFKIMSKDDFNFSYRKSILNTNERGRYFVVSVTLQLEQGQMSRPFYNSVEKYISEHNITDFSPAGIRQIVSAIRADKLPDPREKASSGSFFKNVYLTNEEAEEAESKGYPVHRGKDGNKINSGWLIEKCGFSDKLLYGMRVNPKAALVLINESAGSYANLAKARSEIIGTVYDKFGYWLEQEPMEIA